MVNSISNGYNAVNWQETQLNTAVNNPSTNYITSTGGEDTLTLSQQNPSDGCTDGKDDGKIGFFGALWNGIKGAAKTAVNMVKGCFTDSNGNFSLGKTLLTAGTAALCIAFPAVGLAACAVGAVSGAVQLGKGIYKATTATTDAEAKAAWQEVGGGALTTGLSIAGAKASYGAMQSSAAAASESGVTAMESLGENASLAAKGKALATDMWTSTKGNAANIKNTITTGIKTAKQVKEIKNTEKGITKALKKNNEEAITEGLSKLDELKASEKYQTAFDKIAEQEAKAGEASYNKSVLKDNINKAKENLSKAKEGKDKAAIKDAKAGVKEAKTEFKHSESKIYKATDAVKDTAKNATENTRDALSQFTKDSGKGIFKKIKAIKENTNSAAFKNIATGLSKDGQAILESLVDGSKSYNQLVNEFGYENVLEVLEAFSGFEASNQTV